MEFRFITLFSGSSGNSTYIKYKNTEILVDAGKNRKNIADALETIGTSLDNIDAILVTHEHSDHISALKVIAKKSDCGIFAPVQCMNKMEDFVGRAVFYTLPYEITIGDITATPFETSHDSDGCVGCVIKAGDRHIGIATDTGCVTKELLLSLGGCDYSLIEANYDPEMLKYGPYSPMLKDRIAARTGHLSNPDSASLAAALFRSGTKKIAFGHLSGENNTPDVVRKTVTDKLAEYGIDGDFVIAGRDGITVIAEE